jgi:hypothetical protein
MTQWLWTDAHRRVCIAKARAEYADRNIIWTGLAAPSYMKPLVRDGYMVPVFGSETPRVANWYRFTEKGWQEYDRRYKDKPDFFDPAFDERW